MDDAACMFCRKPTLAGEEIYDEEGNIACQECGEAEIAAQIKEGFWPSGRQPAMKLSFGDK
jgi:hypothetical protein